uniref:Protein artemis n=1 Tax=Trypanosoma vivax (strain Y486) TaxID=1055687 RepID=G0TU17_TRYVY|nr:conserved hypothetical protein [Trypanosoma vivax Y486]
MEKESATGITSGKRGSCEIATDYVRAREVYKNENVAILVDMFRYVNRYLNACRAEPGNGEHPQWPHALQIIFFLSHFHSDHYAGITSRWSHGTIYASRATANMLCWKLEVEKQCVVPLDYSVPYQFCLETGKLVQGEEAAGLEAKHCDTNCFSVTLLPADHCPGSAMFLFRSPVFGTVLHTGDFRFSRNPPTVPRALCSRSGSSTPTLLEAATPLAGKVDRLFLDNTFCSPEFDFPSCVDTLNEINTAILDVFREYERDHRYRTRCDLTQTRLLEEETSEVSIAVLVGSYVIGKELVALSIQDNFVAVQKDVGDQPFVCNLCSTRKIGSDSAVNYYPERFVPFRSSPGPDANDAAAESSSNDHRCSEAGRNEEDERDVVTEFRCHEVQIPKCLDGSSSMRAKELNPVSVEQTAEDIMKSDVKLSLALFLVPLSSISGSAVASACTNSTKQSQEGTVGEKITCSEKFALWDEEVIDLKQFDRVICVQATGWAKFTTMKKLSDRMLLLRIPYSEHCSFTELVDFVGLINPLQVVPTVSLESFKKCESLFCEKAPRLCPKYSNVQPITRYFQPCQSFEASETTKKRGGNSTASTAALKKQVNPFIKRTRASVETKPALLVVDVDSMCNDDAINTECVKRVSKVARVAKQKDRKRGTRTTRPGVCAHPQTSSIVSAVVEEVSKDSVFVDSGIHFIDVSDSSQ